MLVCLLTCMVSLNVDAKSYKFKYADHAYQVYTTGVGQNGRQLVKAWAKGGSADKAMDNARVDAVAAALFTGISPDESTHGMGVANLPALITKQQYEANKKLIDKFFKKGEFMRYVRDLNTSYPSGENNMSCPGGRRVGINLEIDYPGLRKWLEEKGIKKGVGSYFN